MWVVNGTLKKKSTGARLQQVVAWLVASAGQRVPAWKGFIHPIIEIIEGQWRLATVSSYEDLRTLVAGELWHPINHYHPKALPVGLPLDENSWLYQMDSVLYFIVVIVAFLVLF